MCGIFAILLAAAAEAPQLAEARAIALRQARLIRHRGPDWSGSHAAGRVVMAHERLGLVDPMSGDQPLFAEERRYALAVNGEIYNHQELRQEFSEGKAAPFAFQTGSDCEVVLPLFMRDVASEGWPFLTSLNGMFAFVVADCESGRAVIARDPIGIIPLYYGGDSQGRLYVASEMKALVDVCDAFLREFPPGHYLDTAVVDAALATGVALTDAAAPERFFRRDWEAAAVSTATPADVHRELRASVHRELMCDVPFGVLLSGGLDSSIIAALVAEFAAKRVETGDAEAAWWPRPHSFAIGLPGAPDLRAARAVAEHIGTVHHELHFTLQEGLDAVRDVIYHIETYDVTTVRAATPMYLLARRIKAMGIKMVLSGEGADELFGGYLYFHRAPTPGAFHEETVRKLSRLHMYDCLRANKSMAAWGVEARVPFLDRDFVDAAMRLSPEEKFISGGRMEKHVLRKAFEDILPHAVAWRQKEQFGDGVGYGWIDALRDHATELITDAQLAGAAVEFPLQPPQTKEALWYRRLFAEHFPSDDCAACVPAGKSVACSTAEALEWDASLRACTADPSGRSVAGVHIAAGV